MWQDMGMYWAWRGSAAADRPPPWKKRLIYADVVGGIHEFKFCVGVFENGRATKLNGEEAQRLKALGYQLKMPEDIEGGAEK